MWLMCLQRRWKTVATKFFLPVSNEPISCPPSPGILGPFKWSDVKNKVFFQWVAFWLLRVSVTAKMSLNPTFDKNLDRISTAWKISNCYSKQWKLQTKTEKIEKENSKHINTFSAHKSPSVKTCEVKTNKSISNLFSIFCCS